ncbi:dynamin-like GTPase mgm1 [Kappamyces sp. JEL0680]|nr:dynamin-like GTPase mgm1 [Kappamyces sp. JEL0680]
MRLPVAAAGAGMGLSAYIHYQLEDAAVWYRKTLHNAKEYLVGLKNDLDKAFRKDNDSAAVVAESSLETEPPEPPSVADIPIAFTAAPVSDNHLVGLTKTLIEIRNLLKKINGAAAPSASSINLPSIVVIGSQSSGKSSVLEAIVGHEFLPKGSNMVTRRPIELTLVHTPDSDQEYCEFPDLKLGKIFSFEKVQKTLTDLNLAVTDEECVSPSPIELVVHSPNVPDLTLVDLPGYIQVVNKSQPPKLKRKISELCEKYIQEPNIILAVCAADVDLANSEALRASRKIDPQGTRTIGVLTKMDLVSPDVGSSLLQENDYPLALGYIGVVNSPGKSSPLAMVRSEDAFFKKHLAYDPNLVGSKTLRKKLMNVLETRMSSSLTKIIDSVQNELEDARYQFKVHYNDRSISPESYVAECMDALKLRFKEFTRQFDKHIVKEKIREMLEQRMVEVSATTYWTPESMALLLNDIATPALEAKLSQSSAKLTRSGVGKASVELVVDMITEKLEEITAMEPWSFHDKARQQVLDFATALLRSKYVSTIDQVENTIKPYKFEVDASDLEWKEGQRRSVEIMNKKLDEIQADIRQARLTSGRRKLRNAVKYLSYLEANPEASSADPPFSAEELMQARRAIDSQSQMHILTQRLSAIKSRQCASLTSKTCCPEVFLSVVSEKLAATAVMFIYIELLNEFFFQLPRQIDNKMYYSLGKSDILSFCKENPAIEQHLGVQERKQTLELVMDKLLTIARTSQNK